MSTLHFSAQSYTFFFDSFLTYPLILRNLTIFAIETNEL